MQKLVTCGLWATLSCAVAAAVPPLDNPSSSTDTVRLACHRIRIPYASVSKDGGSSFVPYRGRPVTAPFLAWGLAASDDTPGLMYLHAANTLWQSDDDGCNWQSIGGDVFGLLNLAPAPGGMLYAWPVNGNGTDVYRYGPLPKSGGWGVIPLRSPDPTLAGFAVDPTDGFHLRAISDLGQIYESFDGGERWGPIGVPAAVGSFVIGYFGAFDPQNLDHVVYGQTTAGGAVTFDGGQTWTPIAGLSTGRANFFNGIISPADGDLVFGMALDIEQDLAGHPSGGKHIYVSNDGGLTFAPVLDAFSDGVFLQNGPLMAIDPADANVLTFVFSVRPLFGGTTFYRYDSVTGALELTPNLNTPVIRSLAYSRVQPGRFAAGFEFAPGQ